MNVTSDKLIKIMFLMFSYLRSFSEKSWFYEDHSTILNCDKFSKKRINFSFICLQIDYEKGMDERNV